LEADHEISEDPRAGTIHPPTLEMFNRLGLTETFIERGYVVRNYHYRDRRQGLIAEFDLGLLSAYTDYPFRLMLEQHKVSHIISDRLGEFDNHQVRHRHKVISVDQDDDGVTAEAETPDGIKTIRGRYVIGCDGGRSQVRRSMNVDFKGFTFPERFLVVSTPYDFAAHGYAFTNYIADPEEWCALFKVPGKDDAGLWRVLFPTDPDDDEASLFDDQSIEDRLQGFNPKPDAYQLIHRNLYGVHQRVASSYRDGRILIAGDAAHINNPLGGMGMNGGIHDGINVAEKLVAVLNEGASDDLLDKYDRQRRPIAIDYVQTQSIRNKQMIEEADPAVRRQRQDDLRAVADDRQRSIEMLLQTSMINAVRKSQSIE
jgi:3-(3-hydroxy-phenyl)propionate hydroxylase